jgi:hypothetical protein
MSLTPHTLHNIGRAVTIVEEPYLLGEMGGRITNAINKARVEL